MKVNIVDASTSKAVAVTPNDGANLPNGTTKGLYVGGTGDVQVDMGDGSFIKFVALSAGTVHQISVKKVHATGTTATSILALY